MYYTGQTEMRRWSWIVSK